MPKLTVTAIPAFADNYIWLITSGGKQCAVVDPGDAAPVKNALKKAGLTLEYILITHHHWDHTGGVAELADATGAKVFGPHDPRIPDQDGLDPSVRLRVDHEHLRQHIFAHPVRGLGEFLVGRV